MDLTAYDFQIKELISRLTDLPPDFDSIRKLLDDWNLRSEVLSMVAYTIIDDYCFCEYRDAVGDGYAPPSPDQHNGNGVLFEKKLVSYYLPDILTLLLKYGMNPNDVIGENFDRDNVIGALRYVDYKDCAAHCAKILLEHGGEPNLIVDESSIFTSVDFDMVFDINEAYDRPYQIRHWLVLIAYGGRLKNGELPLQMTDGFDVDIFKYYNDFSWKKRLYKTPENKTSWMMHIYETSTGIEVARLN